MPQEKSAIIQVVIIGSILLIVVALFIISFMFFYSKRHNRYLTEKKEMENSFQQELLKTQIEIQEQTLKNIAQEIHDNIGQTLSLAKLNLNTIDLEQKTTSAQKILNSKELVSKSIHDLRNLSRSLNTDSILANGLIKGIESEIAIINNAEIFKAELKVTGLVRLIDARKELILFRIIQEAINNIIKHSDAKSINVYVDYSDYLKIQISDDGKGFTTGEGNYGGSGIKNMIDRAKLIGGNILIKSDLDGTKIFVSVSIKDL